MSEATTAFIDYEDALAWLLVLVTLFMLASCGGHPTAFCMNLAATVNVVLYDRLTKRTRS